MEYCQGLYQYKQSKQMNVGGWVKGKFGKRILKKKRIQYSVENTKCKHIILFQKTFSAVPEYKRLETDRVNQLQNCNIF